MSRALDIMLNDFLSEVQKNNIDVDYIMVTHSLAHKHAIYMMDKINQICQPKQLLENFAGCVISSHCGPGTIGILYIVRSND